MPWKELCNEGKSRGLNPRLFIFKGTEDAGAKDRLEIIEKLNILDQQKMTTVAIVLSILSLMISIIGLVL